MNPNGLWSGRGISVGSEGSAEPGVRTPMPNPGGPRAGAVRVTTADVLSNANLSPPAAQTFDELEIPATFRAAVENELTRDETLLWVGRPSRNPEVHPRNKVLPVIGGGLIALGLGIVVFKLALAGGGSFFPFVFAGVAVVIGSAFLLPLVVNPAKGCKSCYAVTSRRALIVEPSVWQRGGVVRSYLPQQLLGLERRDHASVPGAGDLIFAYEFVLPGDTMNPRTGTALQQTPGLGLANSPQRVARGFLCLDQVREVEDLIRTTLLSSLEQALDAPTPAAAPPVSVTCSCGVTVEAPAALAGKTVRCPRCTAAVAIGPRPADVGHAAPTATDCRVDGAIPADLRNKLLAGLDPNETPVWVGRPVAKLVLLRNGGYLVASAAGILAALAWLYLSTAPAKAAAPAKGAAVAQKGQAAPAPQQGGIPLPPLVLLFASVCVSAPALIRWRAAGRTGYVLTNRRAVVYTEGLFGPTRHSYSPLEVSGMRRAGSWLVAGCGDLIFRTVTVVTHSRGNSTFGNTSTKTNYYGFLAVAHVDEVEKLVRETLIDRFVDRLTAAV